MEIHDYFWARLAPYNPALGNVTRRHTYRSVLYIGGERPIWYKIPPTLARELIVLKQNDLDPRSPTLFEIVDETRRRQIDAVEDERALVALGLHAATAPQMRAPTVSMDLTGEGAPMPITGRAAAIPRAPEGPKPLTAADLGEEPASPVAREDLRIAPPSGAGAITTQTLPQRG